MARIKISQLSPAAQQQIKDKLKISGITAAKTTKKTLVKNDEADPQFVLTRSVELVWPDIKKEFVPVLIVDGKLRKFRLDMAFPEHKLAIEVDGWQYHGKYKDSFKRDRIKQNLLTKHGWRVLRFFYQEIMCEVERENIIKTIESTLKMINESQGDSCPLP